MRTSTKENQESSSPEPGPAGEAGASNVKAPDTDPGQTDDMDNDELEDMIKPELFRLNIPAILEILFGLFLFFVAAITILSGWHLYKSNTNSEWAARFMATGVYFIVLMLLSFIVAYGLILKKRFAPFLGFGKGIFLIFYFLYSVLDFRRLALEAEVTEVRFLSDLLETEKQVYLANMYVNIALLLFVLLLTLAMLYILFKDGHLNKILKRSKEPQSLNDTKLSVINDKLDGTRVREGESERVQD